MRMFVFVCTIEPRLNEWMDILAVSILLCSYLYQTTDYSKMKKKIRKKSEYPPNVKPAVLCNYSCCFFYYEQTNEAPQLGNYQKEKCNDRNILRER